MRSYWRWGIPALAVLGVSGCLLGVWNWYYRYHVWPARIQSEVIGRALAKADLLIDYSGFSAYGQGVFRWRYDVRRDSSWLGDLCEEQDVAVCSFSRTRRLNDDVVLSVTYLDGILTVEEVWQ